jgi:ParB family transcriptional regulator, chromosome partitioning protein
MTIVNAAVETVEKTGAAETAGEKLAEKRRALGRGLESLLPGPRVVPGPTLPQSVRKDGAPAPDSSQFPVLSSQQVSAPTASGMDGASGTVDELHAVASGRTPDGETVFLLGLDLIDDNPYQTRDDFNEEALLELMDSIKVQGVLQPIVVRPGKAGRFILILGERRMRASKMAGKTTIPAIVKRVSEQQAAEMTLVENLQREDLFCLEQAEAFATLSTEFKLTQEQIGKRVGISREQVSNYLRLLKLPIDVINAMNKGQLTYSHARALLSLDDEKMISKTAQLAIKQQMSVNRLEDLVMNINLPLENPEARKPSGARWVDPNVRAAQRSLETVLGMKVRIKDRRGKGKISIEYGTLEDFDRVVKMLKGK